MWRIGGHRTSTLDRALFLIAALVLLVSTTFILKPIVVGDAGEYLLMTESLLHHGTPDLRPKDVVSLARLDERLQTRINFWRAMQRYYQDEDGDWYSYHFWGYSLLVVPVRALFAVLGLNGLRAPITTNAVILLIALHQSLFASRLGSGGRRFVFWLAFLSPVFWYVRWIHTEVLVFSGVLLSLVWLWEDRRLAPIVPAALASMQAPPLTLLAAALWIRAVLTRPRRWRVVALASALALPAVASPLFYWAWFGVPSLIARETTDWRLLSLRRVLDLFFDLNIGLLPYAPMTITLGLAGALLLPFQRHSSFVLRTLPAVLVAAAAGCTVTNNWNHGAIGPSRYAVWLSPFLIMFAVAARNYYPMSLRRFWAASLTFSVAFQWLIVLGLGGFAASPNYLEHSYAAKWVLDHAPALYSPDHSVFMKRTAGRLPLPGGPYVYPSGGPCRKALARPRHGAALRERCGFWPEDASEFFSGAEGFGWRYVTY
jgi:hypothetical protein